jgi:hypothetical protein
MVKPVVESQQLAEKRSSHRRNLTSSMKEDQNRLLFLPLPILPFPKWSPYIERQAILALRSASTTRKSVHNALRLGRKTREVDRFGRRLRTIAGVMLSANGHRKRESAIAINSIDKNILALQPIVSSLHTRPFMAF